MAKIEAMAKEKGCTPAQLTLAWLLAQGPDVVAIPGTRYTRRLDENVGALRVKLTRTMWRGSRQRFQKARPRVRGIRQEG